MTDERLLAGFLVLIGIGISFVLTVFAFGLVMLVAVLLRPLSGSGTPSR